MGAAVLYVGVRGVVLFSSLLVSVSLGAAVLYMLLLLYIMYDWVGVKWVVGCRWYPAL